MTFNVTVIRPRGFPHSSGFNEVADSLAWALSTLGHEVNVSNNWISDTETNIVFGAELLAIQAFPKNTIIYNLEQPTHPNMEKVRYLAKGLRVWEYSAANLKHWEGYTVRHVPIGYTPNLSRCPKVDSQDIDVLFYGFLTPRRLHILRELKDAGLKIVAAQKCYGGGRDNLISRAKVVLNVHHDGRDLFEIVRVSYLMANQKCIISECSSDDAAYPDLEGAFLKVNDIRELVEACQHLVAVDADREEYESAALEAIRDRDYVVSVAHALNDPIGNVEDRYARGCAAGDMKDFLPWIKEHARGTCLEIGTRDGASTAAFLSGVAANGGVLLSVDIDDCSRLFSGHPQWKFIKSSSQNPKLHIPELDVVLVDGDHTREGYRADLERFFPLVRPGGLILSHDIVPETGHEFYAEGLREEYFKFCAEKNLRHEELPGKYGMGVMYV